MDFEQLIQDVNTQESKEDKKKRLEKALNSSIIDLDIPPAKPPVCMKIGQKEGFKDYVKRRLFTLGNFSAVTGKGKSKKTFLTSMMSAAFATNGNCQDKFFSELPADKRWVLRFDTEQSEYDAYRVGSVVKSLSRGDDNYYGVFDLREFDSDKRVEIVEYALEKYKKNLGVVIIDGIADLVRNINDIEETSNIVQKLLTWSKQYHIHIINVIHQNKDNSYATGHLGSSLIKKAEVVISVQRQDKSSSVSCDNIRGSAEFDDFNFYIDEHGLPIIIENENISELQTKDIDF